METKEILTVEELSAVMGGVRIGHAVAIGGICMVTGPVGCLLTVGAYNGYNDGK